MPCDFCGKCILGCENQFDVVVKTSVRDWETMSGSSTLGTKLADHSLLALGSRQE